MPIQTILTSAQLATMRQRVESETSVKLIYSNGDHYPLPPDTHLLNTLIEVPDEPPELVVGGTRADEEAENAVKVFAEHCRRIATDGLSTKLSDSLYNLLLALTVSIRLSALTSACLGSLGVSGRPQLGHDHRLVQFAEEALDRHEVKVAHPALEISA